MQEKPYPGTYLHGININDWYPCWNLSLSGSLFSPDYVAQVDSAISQLHTSLRDVSINELRNKDDIPGMPTPRGYWYISAAASIRNGERIGIGVENTQWLSQQETERILKISEIELRFEEIRRKIMKDAASRLTSLYLAECNSFGEDHIRNMLGNNDLYIFPVTIPKAFRVTKVDTHWFDQYYLTKNIHDIDNYWLSGPYDEDNPTWEYLVERIIQIKDKKDQVYIQEHGAHREYLFTE
jgi:hypothetical protein